MIANYCLLLAKIQSARLSIGGPMQFYLRARQSFGFVSVLGISLWLCACQTTGSSSSARHVYRVRVDAGDTLASIARKYDTTADQIAAFNKLPQNQAPAVGSILRIEPGPAGLVAMPHPMIDFDPIGHTQPSKNRPNRGLLFGDSDVGSSLDWPLRGQVSSPFGLRHRRFHRGVDIRARMGSRVASAAPGVVEFAGWQHGYGKVVIVRHEQCKTLYAHLSRFRVRAGTRVDRHEEIGVSGRSGHSTGPHLHFEVRTLNDDAVDPLSVIEEERLLTARN